MNALAPAADDVASPSLVDALDFGRFDAIAELAECAASYWHSVALAADRGERLTIEVHCRQVAAVRLIWPPSCRLRRIRLLFSDAAALTSGLCIRLATTIYAKQQAITNRYATYSIACCVDVCYNQRMTMATSAPIPTRLGTHCRALRRGVSGSDNKPKPHQLIARAALF